MSAMSQLQALHRKSAQALKDTFAYLDSGSLGPAQDAFRAWHAATAELEPLLSNQLAKGGAK